MEVWRERLALSDPFIVENGGGVVMPDRTIAFGDRYDELVAALRAAAQESGCTVRGFHDLDAHEIGDLCGLPLEDARLARIREYDEPFEILDGHAERLLHAIEARGKRWTRGGRFYHITGKNDKGRAVGTVAKFYRAKDAALRTVGIGDGWNDVPLLREVDTAIILPSSDAGRIRAEIPQAIVAPAPGPEGWNAAVLEYLGTATS